MPFHDLNVCYTNNAAVSSQTLALLAELEYRVVALSISITSKLPSDLPKVDLKTIKVPNSLTVLSRLTLTINDNAQNHRINSLSNFYDLVAVRPTDDKTFALCCSSLECDLISFDFSSRVNFPIKFKTVASALQRGVRFEICYSPGIVGGNDARRNLISGAAALIRATRGRGIILSSEASSALGLRGPWDVINLANVWGLSQERGKEAICEEAGRVVTLASIKRISFRGVVNVIADGSNEVEISPEEEVENLHDTPDISLDLPQVTVVPSKTPNAAKAKRKASQASLHESQSTSATLPQQTSAQTLSKREQKRQAKKARLMRAAGGGQ